jgi:hypothetical protein
VGGGVVVGAVIGGPGLVARNEAGEGRGGWPPALAPPNTQASTLPAVGSKSAAPWLL